MSACHANKIYSVALFQEKCKQEGWGDTFLKPQLEFLNLSLYPKKFQKKQAGTPGNIAKLCESPWIFHGEKPRPVEITPFFLVHPWKFHFVFNLPLQFPHVLSSISLEIPCPQPLLLFVFFFWKSPFWGVLARSLPKSSIKGQFLLVTKLSKFKTGEF